MLERLRRVVGVEAVRREPGGIARVTPPSVEAVAGILGIAHDEGWRVAVEGASSWRAEDAPADVVLAMRGLARMEDSHSTGDVVSAGGGVSLDRLRRHVLDHGRWIALDPPGRPDRTIGSVLATGTAGPLRHGFGSVRDQVAAITIVTGDGRVVEVDETDGRRVALHVGGFGAFGVIAACRLRLRPLPRADATWMARGSRDGLTWAARSIAEAGIATAALELFSPALAMSSEWVLAARLLGSADDVARTGRRIAGEGDLSWQELPPERQVLLWGSAARAVTSVPVTIRLGVLAEGIDSTIDLLSARLGEGMLSAAPVSGTLRWSGVADADQLRQLRHELAGREIPVTLERAPWRVRRAAGHFGAYRERAGASLDRLRQEFDPAGVLVTALDAGQEP